MHLTLSLVSHFLHNLLEEVCSDYFLCYMESSILLFLFNLVVLSCEVYCIRFIHTNHSIVGRVMLSHVAGHNSQLVSVYI